MPTEGLIMLHPQGHYALYHQDGICRELNAGDRLAVDTGAAWLEVRVGRTSRDIIWRPAGFRFKRVYMQRHYWNYMICEKTEKHSSFSQIISIKDSCRCIYARLMNERGGKRRIGRISSRHNREVHSRNPYRPEIYFSFTSFHIFASRNPFSIVGIGFCCCRAPQKEFQKQPDYHLATRGWTQGLFCPMIFPSLSVI
jgi:hypothetical protein